jgi:two-component sensor histidine kinase
VQLVGGPDRLTAVKVGQRRIATTADGQLLLRYADWRMTPTTSAVNLLRQGLPDNLFKGQIVLVGLTSAGFADVVATPRSEAVSGVFVQAQAVDAILSGAGLQRPVWAPPLEWGLGLLLALAAWLATPRLSIRVVAGLGGLLVVAAVGGSALAFDHNLLTDPLPVAGPAAAIAAVMVAMLFVEGRRLHHRLQRALEEHRGEAERRQGLLINELNHRVKNTLATVQSMAAQSMRPDRTPAEGREAFVSRLIALSTAQNLLTTEGWQSAEIADVVNLALAPFDEEAGARFTVEGPPVRLGAQHALALAMALHELAVNAAKFGALSAETGRVEVSWRREEDDQMVFAWREAGGPRVQAPARRGFGTRLIQDGLARELRGRTRIEHPPEGLRFAIVFPYPEG